MDYRALLTKTVYYLRKCRKFAAALAIVYVLLAAGFLVAMRRPIVFSNVMRHVPDATMAVFPFKSLWYVARAGRLGIGDVAPAFVLPTADRRSTVSLASFQRQKPVVLIFGSYT